MTEPDYPIRDVSIQQFRNLAERAGWQPKTIELFCLPPFGEKVTAFVGEQLDRQQLRIARTAAPFTR